MNAPAQRKIGWSSARQPPQPREMFERAHTHIQWLDLNLSAAAVVE
jgi:hypothetical protein